MKPLWRRILGPGLSIILFTAAVWLLYGELKTYHIRDILHAYDAIPGAHLWTAAGLTILSYAVMTGYDVLAMRYIRHPLSYSKIGLASFIGYAFSNNIGLSMIAGASVRYRLYSAWGLSTLQITQVVAFCTLTLWLGFFTLGGAVFLIEPPTIPATIHLPLASLRAIGMVMLAVVLTYLIVTAAKKTAIKIRQWEIQLPSRRSVSFSAHHCGAGLDTGKPCVVCAAGSGTAMSYPEFLAVYLLAQLAGIVSQVPGGLGVFETVIVLMLWGKEQGYRWFNLGMAPFSGIENRALAPLWNRLGAFVFRYGEHFYNFQGLRQYKEKFDPQWRPRYGVARRFGVAPNFRQFSNAHIGRGERSCSEMNRVVVIFFIGCFL